MAHTKPISSDWWYDEEPGDEGPFPGHHELPQTYEPQVQQAPGGIFEFIEVAKDFLEDPIGTIIGTVEDYLPTTGVAGEIIEYLNPEEGIVEINAPEELEEFVVIASEQEDPVLRESGTRGWDWQWGWLDDAYDVAKYVWDRSITPIGPDPAPTLNPITEPPPTTGQDMPAAEMPTVGENGGDLSTAPAYCQPGAARPSISKSRSALLKRAAWAIGQCNLKYSSFKWLVVHTGIANTIRTLALSERQINFLLLNPVRRRGRGISAANIRTVNRTMSKLESLNRRLNCACGTKRTYKRKKTSCR